MERFMARWKAESRTVAVAVCSTASRIKIQGFAARNSAAELQHHDMYLVPWHEYPSQLRTIQCMFTATKSMMWMLFIAIQLSKWSPNVYIGHWMRNTELVRDLRSRPAKHTVR
jgi:hypothetical protein